MTIDKCSINLNAVIDGEYGSTSAAPFSSRAIQQVLKSLSSTFTVGTGANQANKLYSASGTVDTTGITLDLAGGLTDVFGNTITFTSIVAAAFINTETADGSYLLVGGAASNQFYSWFSASNDVERIPSSGFILRTAPLATGFTVTAGTGDSLKMAAASGTVGYEVLILGRS